MSENPRLYRYAAVLNDLYEMQRSFAYAARKGTLNQAEQAILSLEDALTDARAALAARDERVRELEAALDALRDDHVDKVMAMSDEQITALVRSEGRNPDDVAKLTQQVCTIAMLQVRLEKLEAGLREMQRIPAMPFPDPGAHSWQAYGTAVHTAFVQMRQKARALLAPPAKEPT